MMYNISNSKSTTVQRLGFNFVASSAVVEESEANRPLPKKPSETGSVGLLWQV